MSINKLPNECLYMILDYFNGFEELIQLSKVCSRWSDLITLRFNQVKYLQMMSGRKVKVDYGRYSLFMPEDTYMIMYDEVDYINANSLWINPNTNWNDYNLFELFPNIKIINTASLRPYESYNLPEIVKNNPQIKGLIGMDHLHKDGYLENIEMCAAEFNFDYKKVFRPDQLKQVSCYDFHMKDLPSFIEYFPNLKRLNLRLYKGSGKWWKSNVPDGVFYNGPNLSCLKILEFITGDLVGKFTGFHFMDFCPSLESASIYCWAKDVYVDESIKNYNLRDLNIVNFQFDSFSWPLLKKLVSKFPNLQNLAIRYIAELVVSKFHLDELIKLLPKLKLLDLRVSNTFKSDDFLYKYCVKENRPIELYHSRTNEPTEWPKLVFTLEPICYEFDFMKHCFYKNYDCLPDLIDE
ncbi:uncharacterized protein LOC128397654 isoform X1 [Panonychus citri]|uniref:uncharacterized protein LOC128397654 isoform X1 n=1 Tax=Panonychus citri TaxID=50023 RepID=UPI002307C6B4|nr:uncharacterized protein LOC128397654 isoform X1 [Panonychus citri]